MDKKLNIIVPPQNKNWILDTMAKEIAVRHDGQANVLYNYDHLPMDSTVFVMHYSILPIIFGLNPNIERVGVYFTHESVAAEAFLTHLNRCVSVIVSTDVTAHRLVSLGVKPEIIHVVPEGSSPDKWPSHRRLERKVLISHAFYPRKNPDLILSVIKAMPERQFVLLGKGWSEWERFSELSELSNLEIKMDVPYEDYPAIYEECDVYFSASLVEGGGPHSLIEAMMCNMVPVVSTTGNYREYIFNTYNGLLFNQNIKLEEIVELINIAFTIDTDVSKTVRGFTWKMFAKEIFDSLWPDPNLENWNINTLEQPLEETK